MQILGSYTSLQYLVHFVQHGVLEIIYYNTRVQSAIIKAVEM